MILPALSALGLLFLKPSSALQVTPGSSCAALCIDTPSSSPFDPASSNTTAADIVCQDADYSSNARGIKFKSCLECLQKSEKVNGTESDLSWLLYNVRYALGTCMYGFGDPSKALQTPCIINWACQPLKDAILDDNMDPESDGREDYGYCTAANNAFTGPNTKSCLNCMKASETEFYLANFFVTLQAGCQQKPAPGSLLKMDGTPFTTDLLNITDTTAPNPEDQEEGAAATSITVGTIVGIAVGGGLFVIGLIAFVIIYRRKKRKQNANNGNESGDENARDDPSRSSSGTLYAKGEWDRGVGGYYGHEMKQQRPPRGGIINHGRSESGMGIRGSPAPGFVHDPRRADGSPQPSPAGIRTRDNTSTPPPGHLAEAESFAIHRFKSSIDDVRQFHKKVSSTSSSSSKLPAGYVPPPPPPNPPKTDIPSLVLPSVPTVKVPKKYSPPSVAGSGSGSSS